MSAWRPLDDARLHPVLAAARGVSLVMFGAPACSACRLAFERIPDWSEASLDACFYVDAHQAAGLANEFGVFHLPAFFLYRDGDFHAALTSELSPQAWRRALERQLAAPSQEAP